MTAWIGRWLVRWWRPRPTRIEAMRLLLNR